MPDIFVAPEEEEKPQVKPAEKTEEKKVLSPHEVEHPVGMFSSFIEHPKNIHFKDQYEDEIILLFLRRHLITNLPWIIFALFLLITPMLTFFLVALAGVSLSFIPTGYIFTFVIFTQVTRMNGIIKPTSSVFLQFLALLQVLFAISLFIAALAIL